MNRCIVFLLLKGERGGRGDGLSLVMLCIERLKCMLTAAVLLQRHRKTLHSITKWINPLTRVCCRRHRSLPTPAQMGYFPTIWRYEDRCIGFASRGQRSLCLFIVLSLTVSLVISELATQQLITPAVPCQWSNAATIRNWSQTCWTNQLWSSNTLVVYM